MKIFKFIVKTSKGRKGVEMGYMKIWAYDLRQARKKVRKEYHKSSPEYPLGVRPKNPVFI